MVNDASHVNNIQTHLALCISRVLRELADIIVSLLFIIFEKLYRSEDFPEDWKKANVTPIYKGLEDAGNYRLISLTSDPEKVME